MQSGAAEKTKRGLFAPARIGKLEFKNRILMAPMETNMPHINGEVNDRVIQYYAERARGGAGAIIVEFTCVDTPTGKGTSAQLSIDHNRYIPGHTYLAEEIQKYDCRAILQLHHAGRQTHPSITEGQQPVAPSAIPCKVMRAEPRELTEPEIEQIISKFIKGAVRAEKSGYDGVELHAAHGYLLGSFLSPYTNRRRDAYGGNTEKRSLILKKIIRGIKQKVGRNYPVIVRFSADEFVKDGLKLDEAITVARLLEQYGADALHISTGIFESNDKNIDPMSAPPGWRIPLASTIKEVVGIPVIGVGVIREPQQAIEIIENGQSDFIALGRALLADPEWVNKAREKRFEDINRCTTCGYCTDRLANNQSIRCAVNPRAGREWTTPELSPAPRSSKTVHVIGAGASGMSAAVFAARRGYPVRLYEKNSELGGLLDAASAAPGKDKWNWFKEYLLTQISKSENIEVFTGCEISTESINTKNGEHVIVATGMDPEVDQELEMTGIPVYLVADAMTRYRFKDQNILVLGSRGAGLEAAHLFAANGNRVLLVARSGSEANGKNIDRINRNDLLSSLEKEKVAILNNCDCRVDGEGSLRIYNIRTNEVVMSDFKPDAIVLARGFHENSSLAESDAIRIGGCRETGKILKGVWESYIAVSQLT